MRVAGVALKVAIAADCLRMRLDKCLAAEKEVES
jgi:hypothetical protein